MIADRLLSDSEETNWACMFDLLVDNKKNNPILFTIIYP
jgi:hypothetical protein